MSNLKSYHDRDCLTNTNVMGATKTITPVNTIAQRLKWAREDLRLSQEQLADLAGVSQGTIGNIESGLRKNPRELLAIAKAAGVSAEWLKQGKGSARPDFKSAESLGGLEPLSVTTLARSPVIAWERLGVDLSKETEEIDSAKTLEFLPNRTPSRLCKLLEVQDFSLAPRLTPGDMVAIDPLNLRPERGQVTLFLAVGDGAYFLRRFQPLVGNAFEAVDANGQSLDSVRHGLVIVGVVCGARLQEL